MSSQIDKLSFRSRWVLRRNSLLGSLRFQSLASRVPLFRAISRRHAALQFDLVAGFVYSQILAAFVETGLVEFLKGRLRTVETIATRCKLSEEAAIRLLRAGEALKLSESPQKGLWTLGEAGAALSANIGALSMIRHHKLLYSDLADPVGLLRADRQEQTALSAYWTYASHSAGEGDTAGYSALMAATQPMVFQQIVQAYPFHRHRAMLDIGGGFGAFANAVRGVAPQLPIAIFDLPDVVAKAGTQSGMRADIKFHSGSFKSDPLPSGHDLITLVRILHDHDDQVVQALLTKIHAILPSDGRLLIVEPIAGTKGAAKMGDAYFGLYLWAMGSGRPRTFSEYRHMLNAAGFSKIRTIKTNLPIITSAIEARP